MAKRKETIGKGITAREVTRYSGEDMGPALDAWARQWNAAYSEGRGLFGAQVVKQERACRHILAGAGDGPFAPDSLQDYAKRILDAIDQTKKQILHNDADQAAREAIHVGRLITEFHVKQRWENHALRGKKNFLTLREAARTGNWGRSVHAKHVHSDWQGYADEMWAANPRLSKSEVARRIAKKHGGNSRTIRRKISPRLRRG
jgi:hypothetical protein